MRTLNLADEIERLLALPAEQARREGMATVHEFRKGLTTGNYRAAEKSAGDWRTNVWVKRGILLLFKTGVVESKSNPDEFYFFDKDTSHISLYVPVIVKCRDEKTDAATMLEEALR